MSKPRMKPLSLKIDTETLAGCLSQAADKINQEKSGVAVVIDNQRTWEQQVANIVHGCPSWQTDELQKPTKEVYCLSHPEYPLLLVNLTKKDSHQSNYQRARDYCGKFWLQAMSFPKNLFTLQFQQCSQETIRGFLTGLGLASYEAKQSIEPRPKIDVGSNLKAELKDARHLASAVNLARYLVDLPGNTLHPEAYEKVLSRLFADKKGAELTVYKGQKIKEQGMHLLEAVGKAGLSEPRILHLRYRPSKANNKPIAFVGKGITFDTGGFNLKPSTAMREMKKDMAGSAALVGVAHWLLETKAKLNCDFYFAIADNGVAKVAMRPGDIYTSKKGITVEIHNTDAEGRLVLADAMTLALESQGADAPKYMIDVATLTGSARIALGTDFGGLMGNDQELVQNIMAAGRKMGDLVWPLPLYKPYSKMLQSTVADMVNASPSRFGGTITAGLFLENFVDGVPWAHLDIYGWKDKADGCYTLPGASGQMVQCLIGHLEAKEL